MDDNAGDVEGHLEEIYVLGIYCPPMLGISDLLDTGRDVTWSARIASSDYTEIASQRPGDACRGWTLKKMFKYSWDLIRGIFARDW